MKKLIKILLILCIVLVTAGVTSLAAVGDYIYDSVLGRHTIADTLAKGGLDTPDKKARYDLYIKKRDEYFQWIKDSNAQDIYIQSQDGLKLHGFYLKSKNTNASTIIIAHGYQSSGAEMVPYARYFQEKYGFNVLLPDARGHGQSEGDYIGMGWKDRLDYLQWIQLMTDQNGKNSQILLYGASMGGATVMMVSGEKLPPQVKAIIEDCGYTNAYDIIQYQLQKQFNMTSLPPMTMESLNLTTQAKAGYDLKEASAINQIKKATVPILYIHGKNDDFVPFEMVNEIYAAGKSPKKLAVATNAGHMEALSDPQVQSAVDEWIRKYLN